MNWDHVGLWLTLVFGVISLFQTLSIHSLRQAIRAYNQGMYNSIFRMGANAEEALKSNNADQVRRLTQGVVDMSQTARLTLVGFGRVHANAVPFKEHGWQPVPMPPSLMQRIFGRSSQGQGE
jgi:hypothetical protein